MVNGASSLAKKHNISDLAIGLTIVAFGTSAPELVVNSVASFEGHSDLILGNVIGSNNFNLFFILGISGILYPINVQSTTAWREIPISLIAVLVLLLLANDFFLHDNAFISRVDGYFLLAAFLCFLYYVFRQMKNEKIIKSSLVKRSNFQIWFLIIAGLAGLILGGKLVVDNSIALATSLGISERIIALTIVAGGTSLPELVTSVVAAIKKNSDIAIGNVIGSNIFNILLILGISSVINPITFNTFFNTEIIILLVGTLFLLAAMFTGKQKKLDRWEAGLFFGIYLIYTLYVLWNG